MCLLSHSNTSFLCLSSQSHPLDLIRLIFYLIFPSHFCGVSLLHNRQLLSLKIAFIAPEARKIITKNLFQWHWQQILERITRKIFQFTLFFDWKVLKKLWQITKFHSQSTTTTRCNFIPSRLFLFEQTFSFITIEFFIINFLDKRKKVERKSQRKKNINSLGEENERKKFSNAICFLIDIAFHDASAQSYKRCWLIIFFCSTFYPLKLNYPKNFFIYWKIPLRKV